MSQKEEALVHRDKELDINQNDNETMQTIEDIEANTNIEANNEAIQEKQGTQTEVNNEAVQADKVVESEHGTETNKRYIADIVLEVKDVTRTFQVGGKDLHILKGINMVVPKQQLVMLKGRSGSGKTTLLNSLGGLDTPTTGSITFNGDPFSELGDHARTIVRREKMGFIFQAFALMPLLSAYENVELSLRLSNFPKTLWKQRIEECLTLVGLEKRMHHRPFELSGGEQQRVAIAKAIAHKPILLLADEPTAELDTAMSAQIMALFRTIIKEEQISICMTTHDPSILEVADYVYEMVDGKFI